MTQLATVGDLIQQTRRLLSGSARGGMNRLADDIDDVTESVPLDFDPGAALARTGYIAIDDEIMYVWAISSNVCTVQRAQLGTQPANHTAGAMVEVNARFPKPDIRDALYDEINSWPKTVYRTGAMNLNVATNSYAVDLDELPTDAYEILNIIKKPVTTTSTSRFDPFDTSWRDVGYRVERGMDTAEFPSGSALFLNESAFGGYTIRVVYSAPFVLDDFDDDETDLLQDVGMEPFMTDIPPYGAAWRLVSGKEVIRSALESAGQSRDATEVPAGSALRAATALENFRDKRLAEAGGILLSRHGWRRTA